MTGWSRATPRGGGVSGAVSGSGLRLHGGHAVPRRRARRLDDGRVRQPRGLGIPPGHLAHGRRATADTSEAARRGGRSRAGRASLRHGPLAAPSLPETIQVGVEESQEARCRSTRRRRRPARGRCGGSQGRWRCEQPVLEAERARAGDPVHQVVIGVPERREALGVGPRRGDVAARLVWSARSVAREPR
jgi:hypothetical protein